MLDPLNIGILYLGLTLKYFYLYLGLTLKYFYLTMKNSVYYIFIQYADIPNCIYKTFNKYHTEYF